MADELIDALLHEYDQLSGYVTKTEMGALIGTLKMIPILITIAGGTLAYLDGTKSEFLPFAWITVCFVIFMLLIWIGLVHSMINGRGLKLVEIECKLNHRLAKTGETGLSFYTYYIAKGRAVAPGFSGYIWLSFVFCLLLLAFSVYKVCCSDNFEMIHTLLISVPVILSCATLLTIVRAERFSAKEKQSIMTKYNLERG